MLRLTAFRSDATQTAPGPDTGHIPVAAENADAATNADAVAESVKIGEKPEDRSVTGDGDPGWYVGVTIPNEYMRQMDANPESREALVFRCVVGALREACKGSDEMLVVVERSGRGGWPEDAQCAVFVYGRYADAASTPRNRAAMANILLIPPGASTLNLTRPDEYFRTVLFDHLCENTYLIDGCDRVLAQTVDRTVRKLGLDRDE